MIFSFANINQLLTVIQRGLLPQEVIQSSCRIGRLEEGKILVETTQTMDPTVKTLLAAEGIPTTRKKSLLQESLSSWAEILPLEEVPFPKSSSTFLFRMPRDKMNSFAQDFLSLGHTSQSYSFFEGFALCRVLDCPYFLTLKYMKEPGFSVFVENPGSSIWIQAGFSHPLQTSIKSDMNLILVSPKGWERLPLLEWKEVFSFTRFTIPSSSTLQISEAVDCFEVPLRLLSTKSKSPEVLWVLKKDSISQVESFIRTSSDEDVSQFSYAVSEGEDPTIILKARNFKRPPLSPFEAKGFSPLSQAPWLFVPTGTYLSPSLRPSALEEVFGRKDHLVWLYPTSEGREMSFEVEYMRDSFLPLSQWVKYVTSKHSEVISEKMNTALFDFNPFVDLEIEWGKGKKKPAKKVKPETIQQVEGIPIETPSTDSVSFSSQIPIEEPIEISLPKFEESQIEKEFQALTKEFCSSSEDWGSPTRSSSWVKIGNLYFAMNNEINATLCWSRALWVSENPKGLVSSWNDVLKQTLNSEIEGLWDVQNPTHLQTVCVCVWVLNCFYSGITPENVERVQTFVYENKGLIDQRLLWEVSKCFSHFSGGDPLLLTRTFDSILENNMSLSIREIPEFIRSQTGDQDTINNNKLYSILDSYLKEYLRMSPIRLKNSIERDFTTEKAHVETRPLEVLDSQVRLMFSLAFAKIGYHDRAIEELEKSREFLVTNPPEKSSKDQKNIFSLVLSSFEEKIREALKGNSIKSFPSAPQNLQYIWTSLEESLSFLPRRVSSFNWSLLNDKTVGFEHQEVPFGEATEREIERLLNWAEEKKLGNRKGAILGLYEHLFYLISHVDSEKVNPTLRKVFDSFSGKDLFKADLTRHMLRVLSKSTNQEIHDFLLEVSSDVRDPSTFLLGLLEISDKLTSPEFEDILSIVTEINQKGSDTLENLRETLERLPPENVAEVKSQRESFERERAKLYLSSLCLRVVEYLKTKDSSQITSLIGSIFSNFTNTLEPQMKNALLVGLLNASKHLPQEVVVFITNSMMEKIPETMDGYSINKYFSKSLISLMDKIIFCLIQDNLIFSDWVLEWSSKDEKILFDKITKELRG